MNSFGNVPPLPDGFLDVGDRAQILGLYRGLFFDLFGVGALESDGAELVAVVNIISEGSGALEGSSGEIDGTVFVFTPASGTLSGGGATVVCTGISSADGFSGIGGVGGELECVAVVFATGDCILEGPGGQIVCTAISAVIGSGALGGTGSELSGIGGNEVLLSGIGGELVAFGSVSVVGAGNLGGIGGEIFGTNITQIECALQGGGAEVACSVVFGTSGSGALSGSGGVVVGIDSEGNAIILGGPGGQIVCTAIAAKIGSGVLQGGPAVLVSNGSSSCFGGGALQALGGVHLCLGIASGMASAALSGTGGGSGGGGIQFPEFSAGGIASAITDPAYVSIPLSGGGASVVIQTPFHLIGGGGVLSCVAIAGVRGSGVLESPGGILANTVQFIYPRISLLNLLAAAITEELTRWILEDDPFAGEQYILSTTFRPSTKITEMCTLHLLVVPRSTTNVQMSRGLNTPELIIDIGIQKKLNNPPASAAALQEIDALLQVVERISNHLIETKMLERWDKQFLFRSIENEPALSEAHLMEFSAFSSVLTATYRTRT